MSNTPSAFTLMETLAVLAVLGVLLVLLIPLYSNLQGRVWQVICTNNLKQLYTGVTSYAADHSGELPVDRQNLSTATSWYSPLRDYVPHGGYGKKRSPYFCPGNPVKITASGSAGWSNYAINANIYLQDTRPEQSGNYTTSADYFSARKAMRFQQVPGSKALLLDSCSDVNDPPPRTWYVMNGARYSNPWGGTHAVHNGRINVLFFDGRVESLKVEPRPALSIGDDLGELKARWFWPLTE